jgi:hypothetical protein
MDISGKMVQISVEEAISVSVFEDLPPECDGSTVNATTFRYENSIYTVSTTSIMHLHHVQRRHDLHAGYQGPLGNYETMLFIDQESMIYPFGDLPGHKGLGVFIRYETEDEARDGHQTFVTRVKKTLSEGRI